MKMIAIHTVNLGGGKVAAPGDEFELSKEADAQGLIDSGAAKRKTRTVADDDDGDKTVAEVIAMADAKGVSDAKFAAAAKKHLGDATPAKKEEIVEALKKLLPAS